MLAHQILSSTTRGQEKQDVAFKAVLSIAHELNLSLEQRCTLLGIPKTTYYRWINQGFKGDRDKLDRMAFFLAIYHLAGTSFPGGGGAKGWLTRPNTHPALAGRSPLAHMLKGGMENILTVHRIARAAETLWS